MVPPALATRATWGDSRAQALAPSTAEGGIPGGTSLAKAIDFYRAPAKTRGSKKPE